MEAIASNLALGWQTAISPETLGYCFLGVLLGTFVGVLPGIGAIAAISLLLPITYYIDPTAAIVMLAGVYYGSVYGGSTAAILLNLPGTISTAVTCLDGYPMAKQGRAGVALIMTAVASFVGAMLGVLLLVMFAPVMVDIGLTFGPAEYFAVMLLGLVAASMIGSGPPLKGAAMVVVGLLFGTIGIDVNSGVPRFIFGEAELMDGIGLIALAMGLFGVAEVIASVNKIPTRSRAERGITFRAMLPTRRDVKQSLLPMLRGSGVGAFFGTLPGAGPSIAAFVSYAVEKKVASEPERFGRGAIEGVTGPEAANNSSVQTAFAPTLTLGIPGDAVMALLLGALIIHGITPGPMLMTEQPSLFWGLIVSFFIGNLMLLVLNIPLVGVWVSVLSIPYRILYPAIVVFVCIGAYSVKNSTFDIIVLMIFGLFGYISILLKLPPAPLLLGFVLGPLVEENLRRALLLSNGDLTVFVDRPISAWLLVIVALLIAWGCYTSVRQRFQDRVAEQARLSSHH